MKVKIVKSPFFIFKCDCGCGQKLKVIYHSWKNGSVIDFGIMQPKEKRPKVGIVLRSDGKNNLKKLLNFLQKYGKSNK
jgi:hypothetical protein